MENLVKLIKSSNMRGFVLTVKSTILDPVVLMELLNDDEKQTAVDWCRESEIYLIHDLIEKIHQIESISFMKENLQFYKPKHLRDNKDRTWLHIAVKNNRNIAILNYLIDDLETNVETPDTNKLTPLHYACMKQEYIENEIDTLIKNSNQLIARSVDDVSPLELACGDMRKLKEIKRNKIVKIKDLLSQIDKVFSGLPETDDYYFNDKMTKENLWISLLQKNDKYRLINVMKKDENFNKKYYLTTDAIINVISMCHENGNGIVTYMKKKYFIKDTSVCLEEVFRDLSKLKIKIHVKNETPDGGDGVYYKSALFLALISGRLELVPPLLTYCQFDIISYGLLTCLICYKLSLIKEFPDQVLVNIQKVKDFCERFSIAVLNRTVIRDSTKDKKNISGFLNKSEKLSGQGILDIAYLGKSSNFLGLPSCQDALTCLWYEKDRKCPALKFFIHSVVHIVFLCLLSYVLVNNFYAKVSAIEIICYIYGLGYLTEEIRQIYICSKENGISSFYGNDASNYLDMGAILTMLLAGILRMALPIKTSSDQSDQGLFIETKDTNLFFIRLILCISLILYFMRVIYFGSIFEQIGPKLKMIGKMIVRDLMPLIFIFLVFIASFGVAFQSLMFPNSFYTVKQNNSFEKRNLNEVIGSIFRRSTITIFDTHYPFEELEHDEGGYLVNSDGKIAVYFLLVIYMVVVNVMLTNLLIALFSYTVTEIIQKSRESWKANRYKDIKEYYNRSLCPPPLNLIEMLIEVIFTCIQKLSLSKKSKQSRKDNVDNKEEIQMVENQHEELEKTQFISYNILQAFALKDCRHKLLLSEEDLEHERKINIKLIKKGIQNIEKILK